MNLTMKHLYTLQIVIQVGSMTPNIQVIGSIQGTIRGTITQGREGEGVLQRNIFFHGLFLALKSINK